MNTVEGFVVYGSDGLVVYAVAALLGVLCMFALGFWGLVGDDLKEGTEADRGADGQAAMPDGVASYKKAA